MNTTTSSNPNASFNTLVDHLEQRAQQRRPLHAMTPDERLAAYHRGDLTQDQCRAWAARYPREVPTINGEFEFIAASTPEAGTRCPVCGDDEIRVQADGTLKDHPDFRDPNAQTPYAWRNGQVSTCPGSSQPPQSNPAHTAMPQLAA